MARIVHLDRKEDHPAPAKRMRSPAALVFGLFGGPAAWSVQLVVGYALAALACFPNDVPLSQPQPSWDRAALVALNLAALAVAAAAAATAYASWRATAHEKAGSHETLLEIGEGRTRFLSACGLLTGLGSMAAILFNTVGVFGAPQCFG